VAPGDKLTFLSDGVVEARNAAGELFGFDRAAAISTQTAEAIAEAAQAYGQEDDITVLTLIRLPVAPETASAPTLRSRPASLIKP
jgi:serine phosphatase RsbU (regulator of sigma subunit)